MERPKSGANEIMPWMNRKWIGTLFVLEILRVVIPPSILCLRKGHEAHEKWDSELRINEQTKLFSGCVLCRGK